MASFGEGGQSIAGHFQSPFSLVIQTTARGYKLSGAILLLAFFFLLLAFLILFLPLARVFLFHIFHGKVLPSLEIRKVF